MKRGMNNKGMTMVEVLVGFVILSLIMAGVFQMIKFSSNMLYKSIDLRNAQTEYEKEAYKTTVDTSVFNKSEHLLAGGDYVLEPAGEKASLESRIELFKTSTGGDLGVKLYKLTPVSDTSLSDNLGISMYGFKRS